MRVGLCACSCGDS